MKLMQGKFYLQSMQQDVRLYSRKGSLMQGVIMETDPANLWRGAS